MSRPQRRKAARADPNARTHFRCATFGLLKVTDCHDRRALPIRDMATGTPKHGPLPMRPFACRDCAQAVAVDAGIEPTLQTLAEAAARVRVQPPPQRHLRVVPEPVQRPEPPTPRPAPEPIHTFEPPLPKPVPEPVQRPEPPEGGHPLRRRGRQTMALLRERGTLTARDAAREMGVDVGVAATTLHRLRRAGMIVRTAKRGVFALPGVEPEHAGPWRRDGCQGELLGALREGPGTPLELAKKIGRERPTVNKALQRLRTKGLAVQPARGIYALAQADPEGGGAAIHSP